MWLDLAFAIAHDSLHKVQTFTSVPARLKRTPSVPGPASQIGMVIAACMYPGTIGACDYHWSTMYLPTTRSCHHADEVPAAVDLFEPAASRLRRVRLGWTLVQVVHAEGNTALAAASADGQSSSLRRRSTPARFLSALNNRRTPVGPAGLQSTNLTSTRACKPYGSTHLGAVQHNGRNRCSVVVRRKKGTRAANGSASPADQTKRQLHHFFGAAGVVVPTSLPKLLYRKLHPRAVKRR